MGELTDDTYDIILDALDNEDTDLLKDLFIQYNLNPSDNLYDTPRLGPCDQLLLTYIDYVLAHNLTNVLEYLIDEINFEITDSILARCIDLQNLEMYNTIIQWGYQPQEQCLKVAVRNCHSELVDSILTNDCELINELDDSDIEYLFSFDMDEETIETIHVLFNYNIDPVLFTRFLKSLKDPNDKYFCISDEEQDVAIEIIDFLESHGVEKYTE